MRKLIISVIGAALAVWGCVSGVQRGASDG